MYEILVNNDGIFFVGEEFFDDIGFRSIDSNINLLCYDILVRLEVSDIKGFCGRVLMGWVMCILLVLMVVIFLFCLIKLLIDLFYCFRVFLLIDLVICGILMILLVYVCICWNCRGSCCRVVLLL